MNLPRPAVMVRYRLADRKAVTCVAFSGSSGTGLARRPWRGGATRRQPGCRLPHRRSV